jgi:hypothetical protein
MHGTVAPSQRDGDAAETRPTGRALIRTFRETIRTLAMTAAALAGAARLDDGDDDQGGK